MNLGWVRIWDSQILEQFPDPKYLNSVPLIFYIFIFIFIKVILTWREPRLALIRITKCPRVEEFFNNNKFVKKIVLRIFSVQLKYFLGLVSRESDELITKISSFVLLIIKDILFMILLIQFGRICVTSSQVGR